MLRQGLATFRRSREVPWSYVRKEFEALELRGDTSPRKLLARCYVALLAAAFNGMKDTVKYEFHVRHVYITESIIMTKQTHQGQ
jgi:hypothetical protein